MMLKAVLDLNKEIEENRQNLYTLSKIKGVDHPETISISQQLDEKIFVLQNMINEMFPE